MLCFENIKYLVFPLKNTVLLCLHARRGFFLPKITTLYFWNATYVIFVLYTYKIVCFPLKKYGAIFAVLAEAFFTQKDTFYFLKTQNSDLCCLEAHNRLFSSPKIRCDCVPMPTGFFYALKIATL